jgi:hypothetical protein
MPYNLKELLSVATPVEPKEEYPRVVQDHPESDADEMMDADREWFEKHPFADHYYRKPYQCEVSMFNGTSMRKVKKVKVMRTDQLGIRARMPIF